ncbi:MAG: SDR family NAD(P)-dependent oxidoreductase [Chloroflexi bacterium]|nr:SDR family NAD(P)-dependent oxidoreductase [Chloroflexota bacterium]
MSLTGKVVVVTGGARGIGKYVAGTFAREGARLAINDLDAGRLSETERELRDQGAELVTSNADVTDEATMRGFFSEVVERYGQLDVLVNNAGIVSHRHWGIRWAPVRHMEWSFFNRVIGTNLGGVFLCSKHAIPHLRSTGGHILNIWGGYSRAVVGNPDAIGVGAYSVSKVAVRKFTQFLAEEERPSGICVVAVSPGGALATEDAPEDVKARYPGVEIVGNRFTLAAEAPMSLTGQVVDLDPEGKLVAVNPAW